MRNAKWIVLPVVCAGFVAAMAGGPARVVLAQGKGGAEVTGPYEYVDNWPLPVHADGWTWGSIPAVWAESEDRVLVFMRGEKPAMKDVPARGDIKGRALGLLEGIREQVRQQSRFDEHTLMVFDRRGRLIDAWGQHEDLFTDGGAHRIQIDPYDPDRHVWLVEHTSHQILKFTNDGSKLVMRIGEKGVPGNDKTHFNQPSDMLFMPNGDFYVTDGYRNTRVVKFSKDGKYLMEWGKPGSGPGEFRTVHGIAIDAKRRIYVGDRENSRIQIFDENGRFLDQWTDIPHPYFLYMSEDQHLWVGDGVVHKILKFDLDGRLQYSWGTFGRMPGFLWGPHQLSVDRAGNLYVANAQGNNVAKFRPKKDADASKLVGQPFVLPADR
ncbi:MAG: 6-bladed beta-propeller [Acidobacteria bacterium]|nr:MAG: 6-bladed beta-propeller [Acidobacteriota bacterium]